VGDGGPGKANRKRAVIVEEEDRIPVRATGRRKPD
jgi:hypothetical protein